MWADNKGKPTEVIVTDHAYKRMKERSGINRKASERMAQKVFINGLSYTDVGSMIQSYFRGKIKDSNHKDKIIPILYGEYLYLFADHSQQNIVTLVTVMNTPLAIKKLLTRKNLWRKKQC